MNNASRPGTTRAFHFFRRPMPDAKPLPHEKKGYQWPADRLTGADMAMLAQLRESLDRPINQMLHESVSALYETITGEKPLDRNPPPPNEPQVLYDI
jgi:hypothetical protein